MALEVVTKNGRSKLVGTRPFSHKPYAEVTTARGIVRVYSSPSPPRGQQYSFLVVMETLPPHVREDIEAYRTRRFERKLEGHRGQLQRDLTPAEIAEIRRQVYAPIYCGMIAIGWILDLRLPSPAFRDRKHFDLGTVSDIRVYNNP